MPGGNASGVVGGHHRFGVLLQPIQYAAELAHFVVAQGLQQFTVNLLRHQRLGQITAHDPLDHGQPIGLFSLITCRIPDDCIDSKRYPLFIAREAMRALVYDLTQAQGEST